MTYCTASKNIFHKVGVKCNKRYRENVISDRLDNFQTKIKIISSTYRLT